MTGSDSRKSRNRKSKSKKVTRNALKKRVSEPLAVESNPLLPSEMETVPQTAPTESIEEQKIADRARLSKDPLAFVQWAFQWGEGSLKDFSGPDDWQIEILSDIRDGLKTINQAILEATASGHGVGKSALVAWIILWGISTFEDTRGVVTANTDTQLRTKTWPELSKWYSLFIAKEFFTLTATAIYSSDKEHEKTWRIDIIPWSENNTEAFAGLHNQGKRILLIFDESSAISDKIWEVSEGVLTDKNTEIIWAVFGNYTRNTGRFHECFTKYRHRWKIRQVDSRKVKITNKEQIQKWVDDFGEDSDFVRVRVRGVEPKSSEHQFIPGDYVEEARLRKITPKEYHFAPKILTLDNAWSGGAEINIGMRQGNFFTIKASFKSNNDDFVIAGHLARIEDEEKADAVFIDLGYGTGVYSAGKQMNRNWRLIPNGGTSPDPGYLNLRAYTWGIMRKALHEGLSIPDDPVLHAQLKTPEGYEKLTGKMAGKIYIESKDDVFTRCGVNDLGRADVLAMSYAENVLPKTLSRQFNEVQYRPLSFTDAMKPGSYNPLEKSPTHKIL